MLTKVPIWSWSNPSSGVGLAQVQPTWVTIWIIGWDHVTLVIFLDLTLKGVLKWFFWGFLMEDPPSFWLVLSFGYVANCCGSVCPQKGTPCDTVGNVGCVGCLLTSWNRPTSHCVLWSIKHINLERVIILVKGSKVFQWRNLGMENMLFIKFGWKLGATNCTVTQLSNVTETKMESEWEFYIALLSQFSSVGQATRTPYKNRLIIFF